jgi:hypothetical protein
MLPNSYGSQLIDVFAHNADRVETNPSITRNVWYRPSP